MPMTLPPPVIPDVAADLSAYATMAQVQQLVAGLAKLTDLPAPVDLSNFATKAEIPVVSDFITAADLPDFKLFARAADVPEEPDLSPYALKSAIPDVSNFATLEDLPVVPSLAPYALKSDIPVLPDLSGFATKAELPVVPSLAPYALKSDIPVVPSLAPYALKTAIPDISGLAAKSDLPQMATTKPLAETVGGAAGGQTNFFTGPAHTHPRITRAVIVQSLADGTFSGNWQTPFPDDTPLVPVFSVIHPTGSTQIMMAVPVAINKTGFTGIIKQTQTLPAVLSLLSALVNYSILKNPSAGQQVACFAIPVSLAA